MQPPSCQGLLLLLWAGVAHSALRNRRTPGESCSDVPSWKDSEGYNCSQYQTGRWCTAEGNLGTGWQARWNVMETYWHDGYTAISACCACGGGQVSHINGLWQVIRGPCTIMDECILSPNYPGNYSDNERCTIVVNSTLAKPLKTIHWDVEYWFDYLHINGNFYSGRNDPQGVVPAGSIQWRADEDTHGTGWKLCATDEAMTSTTAAGVAEVTEAATTSEPSTSSATSPEPAAPAEPIPCRDVEGWADLSDYSCAEYVQRGWCTSTGGKGSNWADAWGEFDDYWRNGYTAPQACCACGGGQVRSVVGAWQVLHGACTIVDNCIQSPNYPANYSSNGRCAIVTNSSFMAPLQLVDFATERFYDILTINNMQFSGLRKPSGVTPRGTIAWKSDEDIEAKGWKLCLGPKPSPPAGGGIFSVLEGPCTMDAGCAFSPNYPSHYGSLQGCIIQVYNPENKTIAAKDFVTEASYDVLWVNGRRYSGSSGPDGVVPRGPIQWSPDEDVEDKGWKLCPGPVGQPESEGPGAAEQGFYGDFGYGEDEDGAQSVTEPGTGLEQGSSGVAEDSTSEKPLEEEEVEVNGTLPFGKILLATAALCLTGVLCLRCRRNQDKGPGGFSTSYGRSYALDNL